MNTFIMPFNTYKQLFNTIYVSPTSFESPQERFIQATQSHWKLQFPMPEGYGVGSLVTLFVANQTSEEPVTFDYTVPMITKVTPFCGARYRCRSPLDMFATDGCADLLLWEVRKQPINTFIMPFNTYKQPINTCADLLLWEDYTEWQARKSAALSTGQLTALDRRLVNHINI